MDEGVESPPAENDCYAVSVLSLISAHYHSYQMDKGVEEYLSCPSYFSSPATTCDHQLTSSSSVNSPVFFKLYQMPSTTIKIATMSIAILVILLPPACLTELVEGGDPTSIPPNPPLNRPQLEYFANIFSNIFSYILSNIASAEVFSYVFLI